jgi:hypothetical protein
LYLTARADPAVKPLPSGSQTKSIAASVGSARQPSAFPANGGSDSNP